MINDYYISALITLVVAGVLSISGISPDLLIALAIIQTIWGAAQNICTTINSKGE